MHQYELTVKSSCLPKNQWELTWTRPASQWTNDWSDPAKQRTNESWPRSSPGWNCAANEEQNQDLRVRIFVWNHKDLPKVSRLLVRDFFLEIFKIHRLVWIFLWIFGWFQSVSSMFHLRFVHIFTLFNVAPPPLFLLHCCTVVLWYNVSL